MRGADLVSEEKVLPLREPRALGERLTQEGWRTSTEGEQDWAGIFSLEQLAEGKRSYTDDRNIVACPTTTSAASETEQTMQGLIQDANRLLKGLSPTEESQKKKMRGRQDEGASGGATEVEERDA